MCTVRVTQPGRMQNKAGAQKCLDLHVKPDYKKPTITTTTATTLPVLTGSLAQIAVLLGSEGTKWHSLLSSRFHKQLIDRVTLAVQHIYSAGFCLQAFSKLSPVLSVPSDLPHLSAPVTLTHLSRKMPLFVNYAFTSGIYPLHPPVFLQC